MKPFGKCGNCKYRSKCIVVTETMAKVVECPYQADFKKSDVRYAESLRRKKRPSKV